MMSISMVTEFARIMLAMIRAKVSCYSQRLQIKQGYHAKHNAHHVQSKGNDVDLNGDRACKGIMPNMMLTMSRAKGMMSISMVTGLAKVSCQT